MSNTSLSLRFDIDTLECLRGITKLLSVADRNAVILTFYSNLGRSISLPRIMRDSAVSRSPNSPQHFFKLGPLQKQSWLNLVRTLIVNPNLGRCGKKVWAKLADSSHEVGLHGGRNHALWQRDAEGWPPETVKAEVAWGIQAFVSIFGRHPTSFASPGWMTPPALPSVLRSQGFSYYADGNQVGVGQPSKRAAPLPSINTNILGEPGHVGFFEYCYARGWNEKAMLAEFDRLLLEGEHNVVYDHPGFTSLKGLGYLQSLIGHVKARNIAIKPVGAVLGD